MLCESPITSCDGAASLLTATDNVLRKMRCRLAQSIICLFWAWALCLALGKAPQSDALLSNRLTYIDSRPSKAPPIDEALHRNIDDLNRRFTELSLPLQATMHRDNLAILRQERPIAKSIRTEMLAFGKELPLIPLSKTWFPLHKKVLAFPLRHPHGQGGPGTTLAIVTKDARGGMKINGFSHVAGIHPDELADQLSFLGEKGAAQVTSLGVLFPKLDRSAMNVRPLLS